MWRLVAHYNVLLRDKPLLTRVATSFVMMGAGDATAQAIEMQRASLANRRNPGANAAAAGSPERSWDKGRTLRFSLIAFLHTPYFYGWYSLLGRLGPGFFFNRTTWGSAMSLAASEAVSVGPMYLVGMLSLNETLQWCGVGVVRGRGSGMQHLNDGRLGKVEEKVHLERGWGSKETGELKDLIQARVSTSFLPTWTASLFVMPAAQTINFRLVPAKYRLLYLNMLSLVWNSILSTIIYKGQQADPEHSTESAPD